MVTRGKSAFDRILNGTRYQLKARGTESSSTDDRPRFVIFCRGRTGSSLLVDLLNQLPEVHCDGELLHYRVAPTRLFIWCCQSLAPNRAYGFKLLTYQLPGIRRGTVRAAVPPKHVQELSELGAFFQRLDRSGYQVIYLKRSNLLRQVISGMHAYQRGQWHHRGSDGALEATRVNVNLEVLHYWLREGERLASYEEAALSGMDFLELMYERDLESSETHQGTIDRAARYLGVRSAPVSAGFARMIGDDLAAYISNYEEVIQSLEGTQFRRYLDDQPQLAAGSDQ